MNRTRGAGVALVVILLIILAVLAFVLLNQEEAGPSPGPSSPASPTPSPTLNPELLNQRLTVLVIGLDGNAEREAQGAGRNTDTLMLASVSADQSTVTLMSLPRDTVDIPLPDGSLWQTKVNSIHQQEGVETLVGAMESLFEVPIDGYAQINMDDLVAIVDAVGGVDVNPPDPLRDSIVDLDLPAGEQHLDGATALAYVRTRVDTDYGRAARQQEVLLDLVLRLVDPETDVDAQSLLDGLDSFETDLPLEETPTLLEIGRRAQEAAVTRQVLRFPDFMTFEGNAGDGRGYVLIPNLEAIRAFAAEHLAE
jgi:LCP family protein required for cell wall assembly